LIHTGQHYDLALSDIFSAQLGMPEPDVNLAYLLRTARNHKAATIGPTLMDLPKTLI